MSCRNYVEYCDMNCVMNCDKNRTPSIFPVKTLALSLMLLTACGAHDSHHAEIGEDRVVASRQVEPWTDGDFDDWAGVEAAVADPAGDAPAGSPVDLGAIFLQDDSRFLHILAELGGVVTAQGMRGSVEVVLDSDGDPDTGGFYGGVDGADLVVILSRPVAGASGDHGSGVGIRRIDARGTGPTESAGAVGLLLAPTHSSDRFEIRIERTGLKSAVKSADSPDKPQVRGRLRYLLLGSVADETAIFTHTLATEPGPDPPLLDAAAVAQEEGTLRIVAWNVSSMSFRFNQDAFRRVVQALGPDVLLLDELPATIDLDDLKRFMNGVTRGTPGADSWQWWLATGGGRQRTAVGARNLPLRGVAAMSRIEYEAGALERWLTEVGDAAEAPGMASPSALAEAEARGGLSATGAWVEALGREILLVPVDLQSAGYDGSPRDRLRELQARTLNRAIQATLADNPDAGLVIAGDLNLVGSARPLAALRQGLGARGENLEVARPIRLRDRSLSTWRSTWGDDPFSPGRLDFLLYRGSTLTVARAFVFDAADLSAEARATLEVLAADTEKSDHLPLVVDLAEAL